MRRGAFVSPARKTGCTLDFTGIASQVQVLSMNCLKQAYRHKGRICDCAVLWKDEQRIAVVELKGGQNLKIRQLVSQLQGGLDALSEITQGQTVESVVPIVLYQATRDPRPALADKRVKFRGNNRRIIARPCGSRLTDILKAVAGAATKPRSRLRPGSR